MGVMLVRYSRSGGRRPSDDELLELHADGSFLARRTVGGARIGSFEGSVLVETVEAVRREVTACSETGGLWLETPRDGATETIALGEEGTVTASMGSNARPDGPWGALVTRLRELLDRASDAPTAALELSADARQARLVAVGAGSLEVDEATIELRLVRLDASGVPVARWGYAAGDPTSTPPRWRQTDADWLLELPFDPTVELVPGDWLQVWVIVTLRTDAKRRGRLFLAVSGG